MAYAASVSSHQPAHELTHFTVCNSPRLTSFQEVSGFAAARTCFRDLLAKKEFFSV
jgi:hypothetical protein